MWKILIEEMLVWIISPMISNRLHSKHLLVFMMVLGTSAAIGAMQFTNVTAAANIRHKHAHSDAVMDFNTEYSLMTGGAVAEDFDGDGWMDLYVTKGGDAPNLLYMNQKNGTFVNEAATRGAAVTGVHMGVCAADYDSDGDVDIFISSTSAPHVLLVNDGTGHFVQDNTMILLPGRGATSPSFGDIDNDGLLDLGLGSWVDLYGDDVTDRMQVYHNSGNGQLQQYYTFKNEFDFIPFFLDFNGDKSQDLLAVADFGHTRWYSNDGTGLLFETGRSDIDNGMGAAAGDVDNDGDLDIFMTSIALFDEDTSKWIPDGNRMLLNNGSGGFTDITDQAGVRIGDWGWGTRMADFDNDGDLDIYMVNGYPLIDPILKDTPARLFENLGDNSFSEIAAISGHAANTGQGRCVVVFDYDNDGDQDIFIVNNSVPVAADPKVVLHPFIYEPASPVLLRNDTANSNHYLKVALHGLSQPHNAHGIGSRVYVKTGETEQMRELNASSGFNGHGPERLAHFGLGTYASVDRIRAVWTNGDVTELLDTQADQVISLNSPQAQLSSRTINPGESITAEYPVEALPDGAVVKWFINGSQYDNQATVQLANPGEYAFTVKILSGDGTSTLLWLEVVWVTVSGTIVDDRSIAQVWNEQNLDAIRIDFPDPTKHARNLFASSLAMWDAWAAYDPQAVGVLYNESAVAGDIPEARREAISHAAYRVLKSRYSQSVNSSITGIVLDHQMQQLGYDTAFTSTTGNTPAAIGNRVAQAVLAFMDSDGWDDTAGFMNGEYQSLNAPLQVVEAGTVMNDPNHWQPLEFDQAFTQNQQVADLIQEFLGPHWGAVRPFALTSLSTEELLHLDPGPPPLLGTETDAAFKDGNVTVIEFSSLLDPAQNHMINISPGSFGNNSLGFNDGTGHPFNPYTGQPYAPNIVNHADFGRILAEFWADGPDSETPPGHWNTLANALHTHPDFKRNYLGQEPEMDRLEWDVKLYLALNGALHDSAIAAWGCKRVYDFVRPISSIRYMGGLGQSSTPGGPAYHPLGLPLVPNLIEVVTPESSAAGQRHEHLANRVGSVAIYAWSAGQDGTPGGVKWMLPENWLPYQRTTFVTPAFPGYVSGHSTFSRAGAEVLTRMTGSPYFPGGLGTFTAHQNEFLEFEEGPTTDVVLQWATYYDAADQAGISRLYGGIHVPADDGPGRMIGSLAGIGAWELAVKYFDGSITTQEIHPRLFAGSSASMVLEWNSIRGIFFKIQQSQDLRQGSYIDATQWIQSTETEESAEVPLTNQAFYRILQTHSPD